MSGNNTQSIPEALIEKLLFEQVEKPKNHFLTKIINLYDNRYRINVYHTLTEEGLYYPKKRIYSSFFCIFDGVELKIKYPKKKDELNLDNDRQ